MRKQFTQKTRGRRHYGRLIRSNNVRLGIRHMNVRRDLVRMRPVRSLRTDPHPMPRWPRKLNHLGRCITAYQVVLELNRVLLARKRPNLHAPPSARNRVPPWSRSPRLHPNPGNSHAIQPDRFRRSQGQIQYSPMHKRPAIRDLHHRRLVRRQVRHPHNRSQRKRQVCRRHRILVVDLPVRALSPGIRRPIPARKPRLH